MALWQFRQLNPNETSGTSPAEDNFAQEERADFDILVRECIQNPIDARNDDQAVEIRFSWKEIPKESRFLSDLLTSEFTGQLKAAGVNTAIPNGVQLLIIEDSGTTGLCGTFTDSDAEGDAENWNAFWFREGEGAKPTKANGGAGQGKLTMYLASEIRTVIAMTKRSEDDLCLVFGSTRFRRNYTIAHKRYARDARWCNTADPMKLATPIQARGTLATYQSELGINRKTQYGTSFIIPLPAQGINPENVTKAVINEFYLPILRGRIKVFVQGEEISRETITEMAARLGDSLRIPPAFRHFLDNIGGQNSAAVPDIVFMDSWGKEVKISPDQITSGDLLEARASFESGNIVVAQFPLTVTAITGVKQQGTFRVFLQLSEGDSPSMELFVRQDLSIDKEHWLRTRLMPARALTLIDDDYLSRFLAAAEEPTHREWNGARPKLGLNYKNAGLTLRLVRQAANRFLELLAPPPSKDNVALSTFFPDYGAPIGPARPKPKQKDVAEGDAPVEVVIPPSVKKQVELIAEDDGALIRAAENDDSGFRPILCTIEFAYATEIGNGFAQWDAADFYLSESEHLREAVCVEEVDLKENVATFTLVTPASSIRIGGFDRQRQLEMRLKYSELENADDF